MSGTFKVAAAGVVVACASVRMTLAHALSVLIVASCSPPFCRTCSGPMRTENRNGRRYCCLQPIHCANLLVSSGDVLPHWPAGSAANQNIQTAVLPRAMLQDGALLAYRSCVDTCFDQGPII